MAELIVVQWRTGATGFGPYRTAETQSRKEYWEAADDLRMADVRQPPGQTSFTGGTPIWSLRRVPVDGVDNWCFTMQGRGGTFGTSGTCRYGFAPGNLHPADAWQMGVETAVKTDQVDACDPAVVDAAIEEALAAILLGQRKIRLPGQPADIAETIGRLLRVLPFSLASQWTWATCVLSPPQSRWLITGSMPRDFANALPHVADELEHALGTPRSAIQEFQQVFPSERHLKAFEWLVRLARSGESLDEELRYGSHGAAEFLTMIVARIGAIEAADIGTFLKDPDTHDSLGKQTRQIREWVLDNHAAALEHVAGHQCSLRKAILTPLCDLQKGHPADNVLRLPTSANRISDEWTARLAELLRSPGINARNLFNALTADTGIYHHMRDRRAARDLLKRLELQLEDYFGCDADFVAAELAAGRHESAVAELRQAKLPFSVLTQQVPQSAYRNLGPAIAAWLIVQSVTATDSGRRIHPPHLQELARIITEAAAGTDDHRIDDWAEVFIEDLSRQDEIVTDEALTRLTAGVVLGVYQLRGAEPVAPGIIREIARTLGVKSLVPASAQQLLQDPPPPPPPAPRTYEDHPTAAVYASSGFFRPEPRSGDAHHRRETAPPDHPGPAATPGGKPPRRTPQPGTKWPEWLRPPPSIISGPFEAQHVILIAGGIIAVIVLAFWWIVPRLSSSPAAAPDRTPPATAQTTPSKSAAAPSPNASGPQTIFVNVQTKPVDPEALLVEVTTKNNGSLPVWIEITGFGASQEDGLQMAKTVAGPLQKAYGSTIEIVAKGATNKHIASGTLQVTFGVR